MSLYNELKKKRVKCGITGQQYVPLDDIYDKVTPVRLGDMFPGMPEPLESKILQARKVIALAVLTNQKPLREAIESLLSDGLTDKDLPLDREGDEGPFLSRCGTKTFLSIQELGEGGRDMFFEMQWQVLAPLFDFTDPAARALQIDANCALPFSFYKSLDKGGDSQSDDSSAGRQDVYEGVLRPAHQLGVDSKQPGESKGVRLAVKKFRRRSDFIREKNVLEQIHDAGIGNAHLIRHIGFCDGPESEYIIFPWADGETLEQFWIKHRADEAASDVILWSLRQMRGLAHALQDLHMLNCRHGDLKPNNILHFTGEGLGVLKIADLGEAKIHEVATNLRHVGTTTRTSTLLYEGPEARKIGFKEKARSRTYDSWSMGCIVLEFVVWLLHDHDAIKAFRKALSPPQGPQHSYYYTEKKADSATEGTDLVNPAVKAAMDALRQDPRCHGTVLEALVDMVGDKLLAINPRERLEAIDLRGRFQWFVERAEVIDSYLINAVDTRPPVPEIFGGLLSSDNSDSGPEMTPDADVGTPPWAT